MTDMELDAYVRVSQDKTGAGLGVDNQLAAIRKWCEERGHTLRTEYVDNDISATSGKRRPAFEAMLKAKPEAIVVWHQDRLLRVSKDVERVIVAGVIVHTVVAGTLDLATAAGRATARTVAAWATYEGEQKADRLKLSNAAAAAKGKPYWRRRPFGHELNGRLNEAEAAAIKSAVERLLDGASIATVKRDWDKQGVKTTTGNEWHESSMKRLFSSPRLAAIRVYDGKEHPGAWEAVITPETYTALQAELGTRSKPRKSKTRENLLSGIAVCGLCGGSMGQSRSNKDIPNYRCSAFKHCAKNADLTDAYLMEVTCSLLAVPGAETALNKGGAIDITALRASRTAELAGWQEWQEEAAQEGFKPSEYRIPREAHQKRLAEIDAKILEYERSNLFSGVFDGLDYFAEEAEDRMRAVWTAIPLERKRRIVRALWQSITLQPGARGAKFNPQTVELVPTPEGRELMLKAHLKALQEIS